MNFKHFTLTIFTIFSSIAPVYCMNAVKTNLIQAVNGFDVNRIRTLLQQGINNLSDQDKAEIIEAFSNYARTYTISSGSCDERAYLGAFITVFSGTIFIISHFLNKIEIEKVLDQKDAKQFVVFLSYLTHYFTLIINKTTKVLKYLSGGVATVSAIYTLFNLIRYNHLVRVENNYQQIRHLFRNNGFPQE